MHPTPGHRRRFAITVDGIRHEVIVEELPDVSPPAGAPVTARDLAALASPPGGAPNPGSTGVGVPQDGPGGAPADGWVPAPMPGTVTEVRVKPGDRVERGDVLLVLTAMKLENEIAAPAGGVVEAVAVQPGVTVNSGDPLVQLQAEGV